MNFFTLVSCAALLVSAAPVPTPVEATTSDSVNLGYATPALEKRQEPTTDGDSDSWLIHGPFSGNLYGGGRHGGNWGGIRNYGRQGGFLGGRGFGGYGGYGGYGFQQETEE